MCQKQCRDENGFKVCAIYFLALTRPDSSNSLNLQCHCMSEGHQRMMKVFKENPHKFLDSFSKEFEQSFLTLLKRRWPNKRVFANKVYNEFIQDRHHTHMNATIWTTLTEFIMYLGKMGKVEADQTEKGELQFFSFCLFKLEEKTHLLLFLGRSKVGISST